MQKQFEENQENKDQLTEITKDLENKLKSVSSDNKGELIKVRAFS